MPGRLTGIRRYPVKSCRGEDLPSAVVERLGLSGDRRWMVIDGNGDAVTARELPVLLHVHPTIVEGGLRVTAPGREPLEVPAPSGPPTDAFVWGSAVPGALAGPVADDWFSALLGVSVRFVYLDDPDRRPTSPDYTTADDRVSFADAYPLLVVNEGSLAALNDVVLAGRNPEAAPLSVVRFRPNVVVAGFPAWAEDGWRRVRIGDALFRAVKGCSRCVLTTTDPDTLERGHEPIATLARHRRWDGKTWFGVNLVPDTPGAVIRLGDDVEIVAEARDSVGPLR
ncbi:MAG: MOSC domain-containing protein [Sporichthyaceae bacterium]